MRKDLIEAMRDALLLLQKRGDPSFNPAEIEAVLEVAMSAQTVLEVFYKAVVLT